MYSTSKEKPMMEPEITMGQRPDGSPWVIGVGFGNDVLIDAYGVIFDRRKKIDPATARARAAALLEAAEWVEFERSAKIEQADSND
jgi:hypothetical protein